MSRWKTIMAFGYRPRLVFRGRANYLEPMREQAVEAKLSSLSALLAVHVDLSPVGVPKLGPLGPFVGVGAGVVRTRVGETTMTFPRTTTTVPGTDRTEFAWMVTAGVAAVLNARATLELAWRYSDLGEVRTGRGAGGVVWRDGSREPLPLDFAATLSSHGLRLSCGTRSERSRAAQSSETNHRRNAASASLKPVSVSITDLALVDGSEIRPLW